VFDGGKMKIAIVFYSFSGNTKRLALFLKEKLEENNHSVGVVEIKPAKEINSFSLQALSALLKKEAPLKKTEVNFDEFDLIIFGTPVWAFTITPYLRSFLKNVNLEGKKTVCFVTFGSGIGSDKALKELEGILKDKKAKVLCSFKVKDIKTKDKDYLQKLNLSL